MTIGTVIAKQLDHGFEFINKGFHAKLHMAKDVREKYGVESAEYEFLISVIARDLLDLVNGTFTMEESDHYFSSNSEHAPDIKIALDIVDAYLENPRFEYTSELKTWVKKLRSGDIIKEYGHKEMVHEYWNEKKNYDSGVIADTVSDNYIKRYMPTKDTSRLDMANRLYKISRHTPSTSYSQRNSEGLYELSLYEQVAKAISGIRSRPSNVNRERRQGKNETPERYLANVISSKKSWIRTRKD